MVCGSGHHHARLPGVHTTRQDYRCNQGTNWGETGSLAGPRGRAWKACSLNNSRCLLLACMPAYNPSIDLQCLIMRGRRICQSMRLACVHAMYSGAAQCTTCLGLLPGQTNYHAQRTPAAQHQQASDTPWSRLQLHVCCQEPASCHCTVINRGNKGIGNHSGGLGRQDVHRGEITKVMKAAQAGRRKHAEQLRRQHRRCATMTTAAHAYCDRRARNIGPSPGWPPLADSYSSCIQGLQ